VSFNTEYLPVAFILLGAAWAVIRWIGRSLIEIAGDAIELEDQRLVQHVARARQRRSRGDETTLASVLAGQRTSGAPEDRAFADENRRLEMMMNELTEEAPVTERIASMTTSQRQRIYDQLVQDLDTQGATESERAFALAVALKRLGLSGGKAASDLVRKR
jgi:hypothetical protein